MTEENNLPGAGILADTKAMIDGLKTVCANVGLANDSSEYKIITEAFGGADDFLDCSCLVA